MKKILVPIDFTETTRNALDYAVNLASSIGNCDICMLHVVGKGFEQFQLTLKQMIEIAHTAKGSTKVRIQVLIREGNIFTDIGDVAEEQETGLILMGTHGTLGLKNLFGEKAHKVITTSKVPFMVSEKKHIKLVLDEDVYKNILCPINLTQKNREYIEDIIPIAKRFDATIHLITYTEADTYLSKKLDTELESRKLLLQKHNLLYKIQLADADTTFENLMAKAA